MEIRANDEDYDHEVEANLTDEERNEFALISEVRIAACLAKVHTSNILSKGRPAHPCALWPHEARFLAVLQLCSRAVCRHACWNLRMFDDYL